MKTYICKNCGYIIESDNISNIVCPKCESLQDSFETIEDSIEENELDAIVDSIIEDANDIVEEKIINESPEDKRVPISINNKYIFRSNEKCINCGQCKKTCEKIANLEYNLEECKEPICIGCGQCVLNCPSYAINPKYCFDEIKSLMDENKKIVVAIVSPIVSITIGEVFGIEIANKIENKLVTALKQLGFDYVFNSEYGQDIITLGEMYTLIDRLKSNENLPLISSRCPAFVEYIQIYHPELINNISTLKDEYSIMSNIIKNNFCELKGFDQSKMITVAISPCTSISGSEDIDYVMSVNELSKVLLSEDIKINDLQEKDYDDISKKEYNSKVIYEKPGEKNRIIATNLYKKIINEDLKEYNVINHDGNNMIRYSNIQIKNFNLRLATIEKISNLIRIIDENKLKNFHFIDLYSCEHGCVCGGGQPITNIEDVYEYRNKKIDDLFGVNKTNNLLNNKEIYMVYNEMLNKKLLNISLKNKKFLKFNKKN